MPNISTDQASQAEPAARSDYEEQLVGSILTHPGLISYLADTLHPDDFVCEDTRAIYRLMYEAYTRDGTYIDVLQVNTALEAAGLIDQVGRNRTWLLMQGCWGVPYWQAHAAALVKASTRRWAGTIGANIARAAENPSMDGADLLDWGVARFTERAVRVTGRTYGLLSEVAVSVYNELSERYSNPLAPGELRGVPTGLRDLDDVTGGLQPSDLIIMAARPGAGKSSLAVSVALAAARAGRRVGIISLEMSRAQLVQRMAAVETGINSQDIRLARNLTQGDMARLYTCMADLGTLPVAIADTDAMTVASIRSLAMRMSSELGGLGLIIVDYLQLMQSPERRRDQNRQQEVSDISRGLKLFARELNVPIIACAQLSRAIESRTSHIPMLSDLRESGSLEQDSDIVLFIHREELYNPETEKRGIAELHIAKHRNGPLAIVPVRFDAPTTRFADLDAGYGYAPASGFGPGSGEPPAEAPLVYPWDTPEFEEELRRDATVAEAA